MEYVTMTGLIVQLPVVCSSHTEFQLLTGDQVLTVIRTDLHWQKRDILFLDIGQQVEITGYTPHTPPDSIVAERIIIINCPHRDIRSQLL